MPLARILQGITGGVAFAAVWILLTGFEEVLRPIVGGIVFTAVWSLLTLATYRRGKERY